MRGYSIKTEKIYLYWSNAFINFHHNRPPETMRAENVRALSKLSGITKIGSTEAKKVGKNLLVCQSEIAFIVLTVCATRKAVLSLAQCMCVACVNHQGAKRLTGFFIFCL
ncbi:phage integrase N-terminal SAM-like domain-containing protein [Pseudoalteromonas xiamenensis]